MKIVIRPDSSDLLKVLSFENKAEAEASLVQYINEATANGVGVPHFYRVIMPSTAGGDITLRKIRPKAGTVVTKTVTETAEFEDDV